jgi:hypothetical protein
MGELNKNRIFVIVILIFLTAPFINAFGVSSSYWEGRPLTAYPGEEKEVILGLQNELNEGNLKIRATIQEGEEITTLTDTSAEYSTIAGGEVIPVRLNVKIPSDAKIGTEYVVSILFKDITPKTEGMIGLSMSIPSSFRVLVINKETLGELKTTSVSDSRGKMFWWIIGIILGITLLCISLIVVILRTKSKINY